MFVRKYGDVDVAYSPMILASCFQQSQEARDGEYFYCCEDTPLVLQFGVTQSKDLQRSIQLLSQQQSVNNGIQGIDVNCGCPQPWAIAEGLGAHWMNPKEWFKLSQILKDAHRISPFPISVKIRIMPDLRDTVEMVRQLESTQAIQWLAVHGRTRSQRSTEPVNIEAIRLIKESIKIPLIANGSVFAFEDAQKLFEATGADGIMAARGILSNPLLFRENSPMMEPRQIEEFVRLHIEYGTQSCILHHHLSQILEHLCSLGKLSPHLLKHFNGLNGLPLMQDFLEEHLYP